MNDELTEYGMSFETIVLVAGMVDALKHVSWDKTAPEFYREIAQDALRKLGQERKLGAPNA